MKMFTLKKIIAIKIKTGTPTFIEKVKSGK